MKISTRGRYALRMMTFLADNISRGYIPLNEIATKQDISLKYVESIMTSLSKASLVDAKHGKSGGYKLNKSPSSYTVLEILEVTEGDLSPVNCLSCEVNTCQRNTYCKTLPMWEGLNKLMRDYFSSISLSNLMFNSERFIEGSGI